MQLDQVITHVKKCRQRTWNEYIVAGFRSVNKWSGWLTPSLYETLTSRGARSSGPGGSRVYAATKWPMRWRISSGGAVQPSVNELDVEP